MYPRTCRGRIEFELGSKVEHVLNAVEPDNRRTPPHVRVRCRVDETSMICELEVEGCDDPKRVLTFKNTVDDLILAVRTAVSVLEAADR